MVATAYKYAHLAGAGTTVVASGRVTLHSVTVGTAGTTITIYDNTAASGQVIAIIGAITGTFVYDVQCNIGITVVVAGSGDACVTYADW